MPVLTTITLVVDLAKSGMGNGTQVTLAVLCHSLNEKLSQVSLPQVQLAAIRWTAKGNLVVTGGPTSTPHSLQATAPHISTSIPSLLPISTINPILQPRANVKWSKILINGVPTRVLKDRVPYSPDECHAALTAMNPSYSTLTIMQKPSWVCPPSFYKQDAASSLSVAFEDPDGSKSKVLLAEHHMYIFSTRATVKKWKYCQTNKDKSKDSAGKHLQASNTNNEQDVKITLQPQPLSSSFRVLRSNTLRCDLH